ncbi:hypothetical protein EJ06DRAFT_166151 [Trichodelitschia bisporula]|uniref:Uncharacterized protein n=1 Tax=Trichodelitschia bisporula TaxID=703511 RepID=A0A6G1HMY4_9PEZI|nr:hypothetical protein EJ06DRAFT_166151 [Trichodelitschia bisporula]
MDANNRLVYVSLVAFVLPCVFFICHKKYPLRGSFLGLERVFSSLVLIVERGRSSGAWNSKLHPVLLFRSMFGTGHCLSARGWLLFGPRWICVCHFHYHSTWEDERNEFVQSQQKERSQPGQKGIPYFLHLFFPYHVFITSWHFSR